MFPVRCHLVRIICLGFFVQCYGTVLSNNAGEDIISKMFDYPLVTKTVLPDTLFDNTYTKYHIWLPKRNFTLIGIPSLFYIARDRKREYFGETYRHIAFNKDRQVSNELKVNVSTIYHRHEALSVLAEYLAPNFYRPTLFQDFILSPFVKQNKKYYTYHIEPYGLLSSTIYFKPKIKNTQLIHGSVHVENKTGRIIDFHLLGEYDMVKFSLVGEMGHQGMKSLLPSKCTIESLLHVFGNKIQSRITSYYGLPVTLPDSIHNVDDYELMGRLRPESLSSEELQVIEAYQQEHPVDTARTDTLAKHKGSLAKRIFWDIIGDNLLNRIHSDIGNERQGHLRIGPLLNPLYFGYSKGKGIVYKLDVRGNYNFSPNRDIDLRLKMGYSFKHRQLFFNIPLTYHFDKKNQGFVKINFGNGNRITNAKVLEDIKNERKDSIHWDKMQLNYFKDMNLQVSVHRNIISHLLSIESGIVTHRRSAVNPAGLQLAHLPTDYRSWAPFIKMQLSPLGQQGPILTSLYERGVKGICKANVSYERWEADGQYIKYLPSKQSLQLRGGVGFYTSRSKGDYFLDYTNFHENYIPMGWHDDWTGEFELLNSNWYNASKYYIRANLTYESPLLLLSFCPLIGQIVEQERIYVNALAINKYLPYVELGYGFVNRAFSMGIFCGASPRHLEGIGVKFGFELFNNW